jgi:TolA-binding protein
MAESDKIKELEKRIEELEKRIEALEKKEKTSSMKNQSENELLDNIKTREDAQLLEETNRDFIIFYGILFFTCVLAMIGLIPYVNFNPCVNFKLGSVPADILYLGLISILIYSINQSLDAHNSNIYLNLTGKFDETKSDGKLNEGIKNYEHDRLNKSPRGQWLYNLTKPEKKYKREKYLIFAVIVVIFILLPLAK